VRDSTREAAAAANAAAEDGALIAAARAGDEAARDRLVRRYVRDVFDATARVLRDRQLAEDAAQDAFVNALGNLDRFRGEASFRTWLLRIAVNAAHTVARRQSRRREVDLGVIAGTARSGDDAAAAAIANSESTRLRLALDGLPPKQRLAVTLRVHQGLSYREIGRVLACTEGAARVNYHLGVKRLKELMP
jgi:RNA polymerase sigma-70 factor, ECF subfamily